MHALFPGAMGKRLAIVAVCVMLSSLHTGVPSVQYVTIYGTITGEMICFAWESSEKTYTFIFQPSVFLFIAPAQREGLSNTILAFML